jgi:oxamate amidohydrolase
LLHTSCAQRGAVTSPHHLASQAGLAVLRAGGNACEAAVATAAALSVVYPHMTGLGGDGFWLIAWPDGRTEAIYAGGVAAARATPALYAGHDAIPWRGGLAANTVAGTVGGWARALERSGARLPLAQVLADAIAYAEHGVAVTELWAALAEVKGADLRAAPGYAVLFEPEGRPLRTHERFRNPALAETLRRLARDGLDDFYRGGIARDLAHDLGQAGSPVGLDDLGAAQAEWVEPLSTRVAGATLFNTPPATQGAVSLLIPALMDRLGARDVDTADGLHAAIEATKRAFAYRDAYLGDPARTGCNPQALLDDGAALDAMAADIDPACAAAFGMAAGGGDTTWFGVADADGCVVSVIQSIYFEFGSGVVSPRTGITWQNRGASFALGGDGPNVLAPGAKPFHTLNPALARFEDGRILAYGTMGGEGQPQTQAAIFSRYGWSGRGLQAAITAPRWLLGRTWGEASSRLQIEERFDPAVQAALVARGHVITPSADFSSVMGHAGAVCRHADGLIEAACDPRSDGGIAAW